MTTDREPAVRGKRRGLALALLLLSAFPVGFAVGARAGAWLLVPDNAGLVGGAMVFWYGVLGVVLALVASMIAIRVLDASRLMAVALILAVLAGVVLVLAGMAWIEQQRERDAGLRDSMAMLPSFELVLAGRVGASLRRFSYASATNDLQVERADGAQCGGGIPAGRSGDRSRVELLGAMRALELSGLLEKPPACQRAGVVLATLELKIHEHKPPMTIGRLSLTQACRDRIPEVDALLERVVEVYRRHDNQLVCR